MKFFLNSRYFRDLWGCGIHHQSATSSLPRLPRLDPHLCTVAGHSLCPASWWANELAGNLFQSAVVPLRIRMHSEVHNEMCLPFRCISYFSCGIPWAEVKIKRIAPWPSTEDWWNTVHRCDVMPLLLLLCLHTACAMCRYPISVIDFRHNQG